MIIKLAFSDQNKDTWGLFKGLMEPIYTANALKWLKISFESRTVMLSIVATFEVAVGAVKLKMKIDTNDKNISTSSL
jgi:hypothetical protein